MWSLKTLLAVPLALSVAIENRTPLHPSSSDCFVRCYLRLFSLGRRRDRLGLFQAVDVNHEYDPAKALLSMDDSDMKDPLERLMEAVQDAKTDPDDVKESSLRLYTVSSFDDHQKVLLYRPEDMDNSSSPCRK
ncbi:hypothetical protein [Marinithermofilum abyssi]|uniref:hypothetical protein n=1 Tax=Marinithermofilum abyssi TaxID=1571185 RepID=UPI0016689E5C|nr:hypothetical protein [Marinithermofilum abyssi]